MLRNVKRSITLARAYSVQVTSEIADCVKQKGPVVALESTIITHGLPYPANIEMAQSVEQLIRENGAVPATVGFVEGVPKVGLSVADLESMSVPGDKYKVSRRDIPFVMAKKLTGGTTIASTMILAHAAGIDLFATGGLGGVSRPFDLMDVSADLDELSKTPVGVICSGPKSILDVPRTMEYLETKGVPVATFRDGQEKVNIPGFYTRDSGVASPFAVESIQDAVQMVYHGKDAMNLQNGYVFCVPPPENIALAPEYITRIIQETQQEALDRGVRGKQLTPFMLGRINERTDGMSVKCNIEFVRNNAVIAAKMACELSKLRGNTIFQPQQVVSPSKTTPKTANALVVGSVALDSTNTLQKVDLNDSCPGKTEYSVGGVGFNVAFAASSVGDPQQVVLVSGINKSDVAGKTILDKFAEVGMRTDGLLEMKGRTAQYTSIHDSKGELVIACADMDIIETITADQVVAKIDQLSPNYILLDTNVSVEVIEAVLAKANGSIKVVVEPTSGAKVKKLVSTHLGCFPDHTVNLITPTVLELEQLYDSFYSKGKFEDISTWFNILDSLNINSVLRGKLEKHPLLRKYLAGGVFQQAFQLLPYFPAILVKDGEHGVVLIEIVGMEQQTPSKADFSILHKGRNGLALLISHYRAPTIDPDAKISVTGAGDTLAGYLLAKLSPTKQIPFSNNRDSLVTNSQHAAATSLHCPSAVNHQALIGLRNRD
ncbi:hypothetical protein OGAPHI_005964 [Ogataea philodendri]|uniref:Carbohydrate kinase PfkB domain-containing protein n=1 Tax=Ogataea philodendri TaxID=1378263 RepID=A0A9P8T0S8_9ASCO|nr:uncharacterized protein OGAPHI_005964 [Ogataea philodendri]KAH3661786.1 hypothetical protein OGAPHI_005964 [Ogataea philodendri]